MDSFGDNISVRLVQLSGGESEERHIARVVVLDQAAVVAGGVGSEELFQLGATVEGRCFDCGQ